MAISTSDIQFFLSGGNNNFRPNSSLGGQPSSFPITGGMNSLFGNVTTEEAFAGKTDYRCFYVFNKSETDALSEVEIYLEDQGFGGSTVTLGLQKATETQKISIVGPVTGGGLNLIYGSSPLEVFWMGSPAGFATDLQTKLRALNQAGYQLLPDVSVIPAAPVGNRYDFSVVFGGVSANKSHPLLSVASGGNNLAGPDTPIVSISKVTEGSPINSLAPTLSVETIAPARVTFSTSDSSARLGVGRLGPGEGFPVWVRRITSAGTEYAENDYLVFKITGKPF